MKAKRIQFIGKEQVELTDEEIGTPGAGEILVETTKSLISTGTESIVFCRKFSPGTHWDNWVKYPFFPGYLNAGRVIAIGDQVDNYKIGDRVASRSRHISHHLLQAKPTPIKNSNTPELTPSNFAIKIPESVSDDAACWMGLGKIVQVGVRAAKHELGESVVVIGLGLLGQLTVQYARLMGAEKVIAIDLAESRLAMAGRHGATHLLKMGAAEAKEEVYRLTDGRGADTVYDVTGHHAVLPLALPLARRHGQVILLGDAGSPELQTLTSDVITRGVRIVGAHDNFPLSHPHSATRWTNFEMYELIMNFLSRGDLKLDDLITHRYRPEQAPEAYAMLQKEREKAMGVVFEWVK